MGFIGLMGLCVLFVCHSREVQGGFAFLFLMFCFNSPGELRVASLPCFSSFFPIEDGFEK